MSDTDGSVPTMPDDEVPTPAEVFSAPDDLSAASDVMYAAPDDPSRTPEEMAPIPGDESWHEAEDDVPTPAEVFAAPDEPSTTPDQMAALPDHEVPTPAEVFAAPDDPSLVSASPVVLEQADLVAAAALAVEGVAGLHSGTFGEVATYLPGRRVEGIRITPRVTEVHLVLAWGAPVLPTADAVRLAVAPLVSTPVDIAVQDVIDPHALAPSPPSLSEETA